jgi:hypothetical protein
MLNSHYLNYFRLLCVVHYVEVRDASGRPAPKDILGHADPVDHDRRALSL